MEYSDESKNLPTRFSFDDIFVTDTERKKRTVQDTEAIVGEEFSPDALGVVTGFIAFQREYDFSAFVHGAGGNHFDFNRLCRAALISQCQLAKTFTPTTPNGHCQAFQPSFRRGEVVGVRFCLAQQDVRNRFA